MTEKELRASIPRNGGRPAKYKLDKLNVGEKVAYQIESSGHVSSARRAAWLISKSTGMKFVTRVLGDSIVVWRVK